MNQGPEEWDDAPMPVLDAPSLLDAGYEAAGPGDEPGPLTSSLAVATWALFAGLTMMLIGAGMFGTLIAVRSELDGFGSLAIGLVSAAYFGGFMAGSRVSL